MFQASPPPPEHRKASPQAAATMYLLEAEAHARQAARLIELDPDPDAQREAAIVYRVAQQLRSRRVAR
jgi:hypothetical protein